MGNKKATGFLCLRLVPCFAYVGAEDNRKGIPFVKIVSLLCKLIQFLMVALSVTVHKALILLVFLNHPYQSLAFQGFFCIILCFSILLKFLQSFFTIPFFITFLFHYFLLHRLSAQILYDLSGNDQSCYRRHKCHTTRYIPTLRTLMFCSRWADTVRSAADRHIFYRSCRLFLGIDHL